MVNIVHDLYPDLVDPSFLDPAGPPGGLGRRVLVAAARRIERAIYRGADATVVLGPHMAERVIGYGAPAGRVHVVPPWREVRPPAARAEGLRWRRAHGIADEAFVALHAGTLGRVSDPQVLAAAAARLAAQPGPPVVVLCVGHGTGIERLRGGAGSARVLPLQPPEDVPAMLAGADLGLIALAPATAGACLPSKMVAYFEAGLPVVAAADLESDVAWWLARSGAGRVCAPGDAASLAGEVLALRDDPARRAAMGAAARTTAEAELSAAAVLPGLCAVVEGGAGRAPGPEAC